MVRESATFPKLSLMTLVLAAGSWASPSLASDSIRQWMGHRCFETVTSGGGQAQRRFSAPSFPRLEINQAVAISEAQRMLIAATAVHSKLLVNAQKLFPDIPPSQFTQPSAVLSRIGELLVKEGYIAEQSQPPIQLSSNTLRDLNRRLGVTEAAAREIQTAFQAVWRLGPEERGAVLTAIDESVRTALAAWRARLTKVEKLSNGITELSSGDVFGITVSSGMIGVFGAFIGSIAGMGMDGSIVHYALTGAGLSAGAAATGFSNGVDRVRRRYNNWQARRELARIGDRLILAVNAQAPARSVGNDIKPGDFDVAFTNWATALRDLELQAAELSAYEVLVRRVGALAVMLEATQSIEMPNGQRFAEFKEPNDFTPAARASLTQGARRKAQQFQLMREESATLTSAINEFILSDSLQPDPSLGGHDLPIIAGQYTILQGLQESLRMVDPVIEQRRIQQGLLLRRFEAAIYDVTDYAREVESARATIRDRIAALLGRAQSFGR